MCFCHWLLEGTACEARHDSSSSNSKGRKCLHHYEPLTPLPLLQYSTEQPHLPEPLTSGASFPGPGQKVMLQSLWHFLSSLFSRAVCQGPAEAKGNEAKDSPVPSSGEQEPKVLGKSPKGANPSERRPTILLVVGPADHFEQVLWLPNPCQPIIAKTEVGSA